MPDVSSRGQFFDQFIDDYFSECDEHLTTVRRVLMTLESNPSSTDPGTLHELSRALHTLKGLSGMVSLASAEEVAHAMEDCLRAMPPNAAMPREILELLFTGEALLESVIEARRNETAGPRPGPYVDRVRDVLSGLAGRAQPNDEGTSSGGALALQHARTRLRQFDFVPSPSLAARGIGVEMIRKRLAELGEIMSTTPRVRPGEGVTFEFVVAVADGTAEPPASWRADGLEWEAFGDETDTESDDGAHPLVLHATPKSSGSPATTGSNVVRVDLAKLDELMRMVGEMVVSRARLGEAVSRASNDGASNALEDLNQANEAIERQLRTLRESVMRIRLVPVGEVFERMRFAMRDIARETGKEINIDFSGGDTEIDKLVVDRILEPLLHLVRNSASHGIESRDERVAVGKPAVGTIMLRARAAGGRIILEVEDDGAGIDVKRVVERGRASGLLGSSDSLPSEALLDVICSPGFSTKENADMASGRGVGMAVVRSAVRTLGGELFVDSVSGAGTRFTMELPLTLMITDALVFETGDQTMAIPQIALREILPLDRSAVTVFENNEVLSYRGRVIPLVNLRETFRIHAKESAVSHVLIVGNDVNIAGIVVDRLLGLREVVVHPVTDPLVDVVGVAGATELADGRVSLILDAPALVRSSRERSTHNGRRSSLGLASSNAKALPHPALRQEALAITAGERAWH
jgi:two-component system, chemotaxis family, sensor kinase CheA